MRPPAPSVAMVALAALLALGGGCASLDQATRTERGPLLRTYHRPEVLEGELSAVARVNWPMLALKVTGQDTCRDLEVEEYAEERITERSAPAMGPALSMGIAVTLASAVALAISPALPNTPDKSLIDAAGHYGPSTAQVVRGWSYVGFAVGVPALVVGVVSWLRGGTDVQHLKAEQVVNQHDEPCHERPLSGPVALANARGPVVTKEAVAGLVEVPVAEVPQAFDQVSFAGRPLAMDAESREVLSAFSACAELEHLPRAAPSALSNEALASRAELLHACRPVRPEAADALRELEAVLGARAPGATTEPLKAPTAALTSLDEAVGRYAPRLRLTPGATDLQRLDDTTALQGQAALLEGVIAEGLTENIGVVQVGPRQLFVFLPPDRAWADLHVGTRVEGVAILAGTQTVGQRTLPLLRAVFLRPAF